MPPVRADRRDAVSASHHADDHQVPASSAPQVPPPDGVVVPDPTGIRAKPRRRPGASWVGVAATAVVLTAVIVFVAQNTHTVEVSFVGMRGHIALALALLIAAAAGIVLTTILGAAHKLRRIRRDRRA
jgi:uncharacterized integral membrane protein